jgi:hypothetical protein
MRAHRPTILKFATVLPTYFRTSQIFRNRTGLP